MNHYDKISLWSATTLSELEKIERQTETIAELCAEIDKTLRLSMKTSKCSLQTSTQLTDAMKDGVITVKVVHDLAQAHADDFELDNAVKRADVHVGSIKDSLDLCTRMIETIDGIKDYMRQTIGICDEAMIETRNMIRSNDYIMTSRVAVK